MPRRARRADAADLRRQSLDHADRHTPRDPPTPLVNFLSVPLFGEIPHDTDHEVKA